MSDLEDQPVAGMVVLHLPEVLDLNAATPLATELLTLRGADMEVDASAVVRMGAQCLQVLLSARATWRDDGFNLAIVGPSPEFTAVLTLLGAPLDSHFHALELSA
jgi:chemotaxis protein CheX